MIGPIVARESQPEAFTAALALSVDVHQRYRVEQGRWTGIWYAVPVDTPRSPR